MMPTRRLKGPAMSTESDRIIAEHEAELLNFIQRLRDAGSIAIAALSLLALAAIFAIVLGGLAGAL